MLENNNLYLGDCLDIMDNITDSSIDLIITDLPYAQTKESWDCLIPYNKLWDSYSRVIKDDRESRRKPLPLGMGSRRGK